MRLIADSTKNAEGRAVMLLKVKSLKWKIKVESQLRSAKTLLKRGSGISTENFFLSFW